MRQVTFIFLALFFISSCTNNTSTEEDTDTEDISALEERTIEKPLTRSAPTYSEPGSRGPSIEEPQQGPSEYVGGIPVYNSFDEIEYILNNNNDTTYLINFWATWCKPCVEEMPYIEKIAKEYANEKVKVILVSLDFKKLIERKLLSFIQEHQIQSDVLLLADGRTSKWIDRVSSFWDGAIPFSVIYNQYDRKEIAIAETYSDLDNIVGTLVQVEKEKNGFDDSVNTESGNTGNTYYIPEAPPERTNSGDK